MVALLLALAAFAGFGLSTDPHHHAVTGSRLSSHGRMRWRSAAWLTLALSAAACVAARGWVFGPVWWLGIAMIAAGVVFLMLNIAVPRFRR